MTDFDKKTASLVEELALRSLKEFTGWNDWYLVGDELIGEVHSFTFMRIPYFLGAHFVVEITLKDNTVKIFPGR